MSYPGVAIGRVNLDRVATGQQLRRRIAGQAGVAIGRVFTFTSIVLQQVSNYVAASRGKLPHALWHLYFAGCGE